MNGKLKSVCSTIHFFTATYDQCDASLLNENIFFWEKKTPPTTTTDSIV